RDPKHLDALRIALDFVEHERRRLIDQLRHGLGQRPDLEVPVGVLDHLHFAVLLALFQERAQSVIWLLHVVAFYWGSTPVSLTIRSHFATSERTRAANASAVIGMAS